MLIDRTGVMRRYLAALLGLTLLGVQAGLEPGHACPVHDGDVQQQAESPAHAGHHSDHEGAPASTDEQHCCTCIGSCLVAAPALLTAQGVPSWLALESTAHTRIVQRYARQHPLPRLLPFATAPPLS